MIPTLIISSFNTIFTPFFDDSIWINNVSAGLNSIILLLLSMMGYFKYEASSESFFQYVRLRYYYALRGYFFRHH